MRQYNIAIVGIGAVGATLLKILKERNFPINQLKLLATERSAGKRMVYKGREYIIDAITIDAFNGVDIVFFAGNKASEIYAREAVKKGAIVIDNSSFFRLDNDVPLIVPEVNPEAIRNHNGIIANPNCSTIQMCVALKPFYNKSRIKRIIISTYQAVSGAGQEAMDELIKQTKEVLVGESPTIEIFQYQIAFNLIPHIDIFMNNKYTKEEMKITLETQKIFNDYDMKISATAVRVPILRSHSESVTIETENKITRDEALELLANEKGIILQDDSQNNIYPMPCFALDTDDVYIGRVREDLVFNNGISFFVVADQLRKGAATNAVQIAELLLKEKLV